jgi:DNA-binding MarR family transcriptional regulator
MEQSINITKELLDYLNAYSKEKSREPKDLREFIVWLSSLFFETHHSAKMNKNESDLDMELTFLLIMQNRHYKTYSKKVLQNSEMKTPDDFSFLYHLSLVDSFRKMELINIHLLEAPSGIEVLKRLLKKKLIEEFDDPDDKRAKRIRLTKKGGSELKKIVPQMQEVYKHMTAGMSMKEKLHVISFLNKINDFHLNKLN